MRKVNLTKERIITILSAAVFIPAIIYGLVILKAEIILLGLLGFAFAFIPWLVQKIFKVKISWFLMLQLTAFAIIAIGIGKIIDLYEVNSWWDKIAHGYSGFLIAWIAYSVIDFSIRESNLKRKFLFAVIGAVAISLAIALLWEVFEFGIDSIFGSNWQMHLIEEGAAGRTALMDTMIDVVCCLGGTVVFVTVAVLMRNTKILKNSVTKIKSLKIETDANKE
jgi:hypothetical protein